MGHEPTKNLDLCVGVNEGFLMANLPLPSTLLPPPSSTLAEG